MSAEELKIQKKKLAELEELNKFLDSNIKAGQQQIKSKQQVASYPVGITNIEQLEVSFKSIFLMSQWYPFFQIHLLKLRSELRLLEFSRIFTNLVVKMPKVEQYFLRALMV